MAARGELSAALQGRDWPRAREVLERMVALRPQEPSLHLTLGSVLRNLYRTTGHSHGLLEQADRSYLASERLDPQNAELAVLRASLADEMHRHLEGSPSRPSSAEVEALHRAAIRAAPSASAPWLGLGEWLRRADEGDFGRLAETASVYATACRLDPTDADAALTLGLHEHQLGHVGAAAASYRAAIALNPSSAEAYRLLGSLRVHNEPAPQRRAEDALRAAPRTRYAPRCALARRGM